MSARLSLKRLYTTTKVPVDEHCLPLKPTWSINNLYGQKSNTDEHNLLSNEQFERLLSLARVRVKDEEEASRLKSAIHQLQRFTETVKNLDLQLDDEIRPLTHLWKQNKGQLLRDDNSIEINTTEQRGRALLDHASKRSGHFYTVEQKGRREDLEE